MMRTVGYVLMLALLVGVGAGGWKAVELMSSDAVSMAVGFLGGLLPGFTLGILFCNWADWYRRRNVPEFRRGEVLRVQQTGTSLVHRNGTAVMR